MCALQFGNADELQYRDRQFAGVCTAVRYGFGQEKGIQAVSVRPSSVLAFTPASETL